MFYKSFFPCYILIVGLICIQGGAEKGVVYYVSPTEPLGSCLGNSSCPHGHICHTMDYLAEHSSEFFSPDHINITLMFMCGVHNCTKDLTVQNLTSFIMNGVGYVNQIIDYSYHLYSKPICSSIQFIDINFVNITNLTVRCPSINLSNSFLTVMNSDLQGYINTNESLSFINITGRGSKALLDNCTFKHNCFIVSNFSDGIIVTNSTFQSYKHRINSIIVAFSSVVTLMGNVNFSDSLTGRFHPTVYSSGTAVFLRTTHPSHRSVLNLTINAVVCFTNLTSNHWGGAVYGENSDIHVGVKAQVIFMHNIAAVGGAIYLTNGSVNVSIQSNVVFAYNLVHIETSEGGAIFLSNGALTIDTAASVRFSHNSAAASSGGAIQLEHGHFIINSNANVNINNNSALKGGAFYLENSTMSVDTNGIQFCDNRGSWGGAVYLVYGTLHVNKSLEFIMNTAQVQGGAIYIESGDSFSVKVDNSAKLLLFNNSAFQGGALYVIPSSFTIKVGYQSIIQFVNNTAFDVGGAVYSEMQSAAPCMFMVTDYSAKISFIGNHANHSVGHHMYGTSVRDDKCDSEHVDLANKQGKPYCWHRFETRKSYEYIKISFDPDLNATLSPVSSTPRRVCLCGSNGKPQCANFSQIFTNVSIYRGETFTLSASIVGYDFGTTFGIVHTGFLYPNPFSQLQQSQYNQPINKSEMCTNLEYTVFTKHDTEIIRVQSSFLPVPIKFCAIKTANKNSLSDYQAMIRYCIDDYSRHDDGCLNEILLTTPVFINVTLLPGCPPGLTLNHDRAKCSCYPVLADNDFQCSVQNRTGLLKWNSTMWVNSTFNNSRNTGVIYNMFCPQHYCKVGEKTINIGDDPNEQCASNRTGILCGACKENFNLAIGSSRCIKCPNNHNLALLLAFAAAGVFLVFFILIANFTVTQGLVNRLNFYANTVWAYKLILFPSEIQKNCSHFLQVFIAWLNLDFGIESCFFFGLDAYWKTWLQFLFPFYIWAIAGVIIVACRHSSRLTILIGCRAVPLLATLFLLSYMKFLRTITDAIFVAVITEYPQNTYYAVWYLDGNLRYCHHPHIYLFIAAIATLVFLWLPYTLLLLFIQPLRRISHLRPLKWINKLAPVFDAYFFPLKDKHQYWFGTMLLVRAILMILLTIISAANPKLNMFMLFITIAILFFFLSVKNVYKQTIVRVHESAILLNLMFLSVGTLYEWESTMSRMTLLEISIAIVFAQFCVIIVWNLIKPCFNARWKCMKQQPYDKEEVCDDINHDRIEDPELEPLIPKSTY